MTKTFKSGAIFFTTVLWLVIMRIVFGYLPMSDNASSWLFSFLVQVIGMGLIPLLLYKKFVGGDLKEAFYVKPKINPMNYVIVILIGFLLYYLTMGVSLIYQNIIRVLGFTHITTAPGTIYSGVEVLIMDLLTVAVLPAIFEELTDRGLVMTIFKHEKDERKVIVFMAIIFALCHQNITQTGYTFVGGLIFAFIAIKTKSILPGMIIHFINNGLSVLFSYSEQTGGAMGRLQDSFYSYLNSNFLAVFLSWAATAGLILALLFLIYKINPKKPVPELRQEPHYMNAESIYNIFGPQRPLIKPVEEKAEWWEYGMVIAAMVMAFLTTIFTFIWGVWR